jgi:hypothetical protein
MHVIGEDAAERLGVIPAQYRVIVADSDLIRPGVPT